MLLRLRQFGLATAGALTAAAIATGALAQTDELPNGPGKAQLIDVCTQCHAIGIVIAQDRAPDEWAEIMQRMIGMGAPANPDQQHAILGYLQKNFAKGGGASAATAAAASVPPPKPSPAPATASGPSKPAITPAPRKPVTATVPAAKSRKVTVTRTVTVTKTRPRPRVVKPRP